MPLNPVQAQLHSENIRSIAAINSGNNNTYNQPKMENERNANAMLRPLRSARWRWKCLFLIETLL